MWVLMVAEELQLFLTVSGAPGAITGFNRTQHTSDP